MANSQILADIGRTNSVIQDTLVVGRRFISRGIAEVSTLIVDDVLQLSETAQIIGFNIDGKNINAESIVADSIRTKHLSITSNNDQLTFGNTSQVTWNIDTSSSAIITFPSVGNASVVMTEGNQSINGIKTFNDPVIFLGGFSLAALTLSDTSNQLTMGVGDTIVINSPTPAASRIYTTPDVGANADFIMSEGAQTINGVKTFNDVVIFNVGFALANITLTATSNQITLGSVQTIVLTAPTPISSHTYTIVDVGANADFILSEGNQTINGIKTFSDMVIFLAGFAASNLNLSNTSNQLSFGTGTLVTFNVPTPAANRIYTAPDVLANADFIMSEGDQTINGVKTFDDLVIFNVGFTLASLTLSATSNQLTFGTGFQIVMNAPTPSATHTYTLTDVGADANFVMTAGGQTVGGAKTLTSALTVTPTSNQFVLGAVQTITVSAPTPAASRVYSMPDVGANANFVMTQGGQTIAGAKVFSTQIAVTPTSNQFVLGAVQTITVTAPTPAASRVYTIIDAGSAASFVMTNSLSTQQISGTIGSQTYRFYPGGFGSPFILVSGASTPAGNLNYRMPINTVDADFVMTEGDQTINGVKTFTSDPIFPGGGTGIFGSISLTNTTNQIVLGTTNTTTINSVAPSASRVYTIPDAGFDTSFIMGSGNQTISGIKSFTSGVPITALGNQLVFGNITTVTLNAPIALFSGSRQYTMEDVGANAIFIMNQGAQTINGVKTFTSDPIFPGGGVGAFGSITLSNTTNQIRMGTTNTTTLNATAPSASRVYTIPDVSANANFIMSEGAQTINGVKTFTSAPVFPALSSLTMPSITLTNTTNQIVMGTTNTTTVSATAPSVSRVYTMPDVGANAEFIMSQGSQTINGVKSIPNGATLSFQVGATISSQVPIIFPFTSNTIITMGSVTTISLRINADPVANRTYTFPDAGANANFILSEGAQTINGAKTMSNLTATFPTTGGTGAALSFYEVINGTVDYTCNSFTGTQTKNYYLVRIGQMVTLQLQGFSVVSNGGSSGNIVSTLNFLPARFRPPVTVDFLINVVRFSVQSPGICEIDTGGTLTMTCGLISATPSSLPLKQAFPNGVNNTGFVECAMTWITTA